MKETAKVWLFNCLQFHLPSKGYCRETGGGGGGGGGERERKGRRGRRETLLAGKQEEKNMHTFGKSGLVQTMNKRLC